MSKYDAGPIFQEACRVANNRRKTTRIGDIKKGYIEVDTAGLYYDTAYEIPCSEYVIKLKYLDDRYEYYDDYHRCFHDYIPGERFEIDEEKEKPIFSANLRRVMAERNLDCETLSELSGVSRRIIESYMNGKSFPTRKHLSNISIGLHCDITDLTLPH